MKNSSSHLFPGMPCNFIFGPRSQDLFQVRSFWLWNFSDQYCASCGIRWLEQRSFQWNRNQHTGWFCFYCTGSKLATDITDSYQTELSVYLPNGHSWKPTFKYGRFSGFRHIFSNIDFESKIAIEAMVELLESHCWQNCISRRYSGIPLSLMCCIRAHLWRSDFSKFHTNSCFLKIYTAGCKTFFFEKKQLRGVAKWFFYIFLRRWKSSHTYWQSLF